MKRLTVRLVISYLLLAAVVLAGAGAFSYRLLRVYFANADQFLAEAQVEAAINFLLWQTKGAEEVQPLELARQVEAYYPMVRASVEKGISGWEQEMVAPVREKLAMAYKESMQIARKSPVFIAARVPKSNAVVLSWATDGTPMVVIRFSAADPTHGKDALGQMLLGTFALALTAAAIMAVWFSRTLTAPLRRFVEATDRLAQGEWETPLPSAGPVEIQHLSDGLRRMARRLSADFRRLRADREQLQSLAAEVAHEIKTPIASLKTYHEQLLDGAQDDPESREEFLRRGARQVARLEYLAEFLVDMARLRANTAQADRKEADLADLAAQAVEGLAPEAGERGVRIRLSAAGALPVLASPQRVGQALDNLLRNALRWSPAGSTITVSASASPAGEAAVTVADQGPGIPPDLLPRIFEPFVRGEGSQGMGLGLAIVAAIAHAHGGRAEARNREQGGAEFIFSLPLFRGQ